MPLPPLLLSTLTGRHTLRQRVLQLASKRTLALASLRPTHFLQRAFPNKPTAPSIFHSSHHWKTICFATSVHHRIVACFATKVEETARKTVWKSSMVGQDASAADKSYREKLYKKIMLDLDISKVVKEEMVLYELTNTTAYRVIFALVVLQYIFWIFCAQILFAFYRGEDSAGNKLKDLYKNKKESGEDSSFTKTWLENISANGLQTLVSGFFFLIGHLIAAVVLYLVTRVVSRITLLPGGKQVAIQNLTVFGGAKSNRVKLHNVSDLSSSASREQPVNYITLKTRGKNFSYLIDRSGGQFSNEKIYDQTVGVSRNLKLATEK